MATGELKGLDLGTSRIVLATMNGEKVNFTAQRNAFVELPYVKMTETMLGSEGILHTVDEKHLYVYGNRADEFAKFLDGEERRPMARGLLNPNEPKNLEMIELLITHLCGEAREGEKICFSIPTAPSDRKSDLVFHERSVLNIFQELGYTAQSVNEGLAIVYSELRDTNFTGIGMSFGGGMCNICLAYLGLPVFTVATTHSGDYIDQSAASVTGETPTTARLHKEQSFRLDGNDGNDGNALDHAISIYYSEVIETAVKALQTAMAETKKLPRFTGPIPLVCAGGTAMAKGFLAELETALKNADLPVKFSKAYLAKDVLNTTAKGTLVAAMLNM
jgi:hypothetical protein